MRRLLTILTALIILPAYGRPVPHAAVVVFAANRDLWGPLTRYSSEARTDTTGAFSILRLPPGDYFMAAVAGARDGELQDPDRLESLASTAAPVRIDEGQRVQVTLRVSR